MKKYLIVSVIALALTTSVLGFGDSWVFDPGKDNSSDDGDWGDSLFNDSEDRDSLFENDVYDSSRNVQWAYDQGEIASTTLDQRPEEGNLLVAVSTHRYSSSEPVMKMTVGT